MGTPAAKRPGPARIGRWLAAWVLVLASACAPLPEYARPRGQLLEMTGPPGAHLVGYRALSREDFQAVGLPEHRGEPHGRLGAFLCAGIYPAAESRLVAEPVFTADGRILYRMAARALSYRAMVDPGCS